jgi:peptidyl-prolyl cis-trans isomerase SurA
MRNRTQTRRKSKFGPACVGTMVASPEQSYEACEPHGTIALKGHGFSRAASESILAPALAAEGCFEYCKTFPQGLKPHDVAGRQHGTAEEAAEKVGVSGEIGEKHPSGAKARLDFAALMERLKSYPFKAMSFSAACEAVPFQNTNRHDFHVHAIALAVCLALLGASGALAQNPAPTVPPVNAVVLDRVVAVVNNQAILASDVDDEVRLAVLDPSRAGVVLTPKRALEQLISRALIQQQIRQEDAQAAESSQVEIDARLAEIRKEVPACIHFNCATERGWSAFLVAHGLTPQRVESYLRYRVQILRFIEQRFRQGIRIAPEEIEKYYRETLRPQYAPGEAIPPLDEVAPRIQEILLERQVNVLFDDWLRNLRKQGDVEVLDPALETPETPPGTGKGGA